jgi:hypothetical protein
MTDRKEDTRNPSPGSKAGGDKLEIVKLLVIAVLCSGLGFALVYIFFGPPIQGRVETGQTALSDQRSTLASATDVLAAPPLEAEPVAMADTEETRGSRYAPEGAGPGYGVQEEIPLPPAADMAQPLAPTLGASVDRGSLPPVVPPGKTPEGVAVDGNAFYVKCWDKAGAALETESCDKLDLLEKRFSTRLYVVDKCRLEAAGAEAAGKLSLGVEVDFSTLSVSFWSGPSSNLPSADAVAQCLRTELRGLPVDGVPHKHGKYRMFFTVLFGKKFVQAASDKTPQSVAGKTDAKSAPARKGKTVKVALDRVRVRKSPVDGEEIGRISSGNEVQLLGRKEEWCRVLTPAGNEGWMICDALEL